MGQVRMSYSFSENREAMLDGMNNGLGFCEKAGKVGAGPLG